MTAPVAIFELGIALVLGLFTYAAYYMLIAPLWNPLRGLPGPPVKGLFGNHMGMVLDPYRSPRAHDLFLRKYGRNVQIRGLGPWDTRLLTLDPTTLSHIMKNSTIYEKPWQSRRLITSLIGCGLLAAEGDVHRRQRRVVAPAFGGVGAVSVGKVVPVVWKKGDELASVLETLVKTQGPRVDVCHWISKATFDVIGLAGFDYDFSALHDESNELFAAYKEMFEVAVSRNQGLRTIVGIYCPWVNALFPDTATRTVQRCQEVIRRVAGKLVQEKKRKISEGERNGVPYEGRDLLSLLLKSNANPALPPAQRISDADILHNINTFMFAGSDTTSLALTWTLLLLARDTAAQTRLRTELLSLAVTSADSEEEMQALNAVLADLPFLHNVVREALRLIPPVHSSLRVATQDDIVPTSAGAGIHIQKGSFVHVPVEAFNLDKGVWGEDAWEFKPDRWDDLPEPVMQQPGLFSNILTFSAGPRSCIGMRMSLIEMKTFLCILLTRFSFAEVPGEKVIKANVVLTRPYVSKKFAEGSQCPLLVSLYEPHNPPS
ncbi:hypothetical protein PLICRDRAFT_36852 [Plicaturopsis crispa FD-325 SS-3]|nr:hypothetical protein PLICRDRAFT_36852 [Plicaturopsis crispa FD-325 SS-3]